MKKIFLLLAITFSWINLSAQKDKLNQLFDQYQDAKGVTSIKIAKPMFNMLSKLDIEDAELDKIKPLLSKINGIKILVVERPEIKDSLSVDSKKLIANFKNLSSEISTAVSKLNYEELMTVNSKDNKVRFLAIDTANGILDNLLLSVNSKESNVLLMLDGKISMDDVNALISEAQEMDKK